MSKTETISRKSWRWEGATPCVYVTMLSPPFQYSDLIGKGRGRSRPSHLHLSQEGVAFSGGSLCTRRGCVGRVVGAGLSLLRPCWSSFLRSSWLYADFAFSCCLPVEAARLTGARGVRDCGVLLSSSHSSGLIVSDRFSSRLVVPSFCKGCFWEPA